MRDKLKILLIDDDPFDRIAVHRHFKAAQIPADIEDTDSALDALEAIRLNTFDCVFIDYLLPDSDGLSLLKNIRTAGILTPIIVLTGYGDERLAVDMIQAGATDYLAKAQLSGQTLSHCLQRAMRLHNAEMKRRQAEDELIRLNKLVIDILESISDAFFAIDTHWHFTYINKQAEALFRGKREKMIGRNVWEQLSEIPALFRDVITKSMEKRLALRVEGHYPSLNNWLELRAYPGYDGISVYFQDITERKKTEAQLNFMANHDHLTDLPNRNLLMDRLAQSVSRVHWHDRLLAVLFCDLDGFKKVNDELGHSVGDSLLKLIAERYLACLRPGDTVARLGGDEFIVVLNDVAEVEDVIEMANKIVKTISMPVTLGNQVFSVTVSIGISIFPTDAEDPETLLRFADIAMYEAKQRGKNQCSCYFNLAAP